VTDLNEKCVPRYLQFASLLRKDFFLSPQDIMENIQTDEETQPLAASPTRRVAEAYSHNDSRK
jgi:hypothetical protein